MAAEETSPPAPDQEIEQLKQELEAERQRSAEYRENWARAQADLANARRRQEQEKLFHNALLMADLLPVLDNFDRAFATLPQSLAGLTWFQGVFLIERHLRSVMEQRGLTVIACKGKPFTAAEHEAVAEEEVTEGEDHVVLEEIQKGYKLNERVLRPAMVKISRKVQRGESSAPSETPAAEAPPGESAAP